MEMEKRYLSCVSTGIFGASGKDTYQSKIRVTLMSMERYRL